MGEQIEQGTAKRVQTVWVEKLGIPPNIFWQFFSTTGNI